MSGQDTRPCTTGRFSASPRSARRAIRATVLIGLLALAGCTGAADEDGAGPVIVQPGAPGEPGRMLRSGPPAAPATYTHADVWFMQQMIPHHAQALRMTGLVPERTAREEIALFARRIEVAQAGEIRQMEDWLELRGESVEPHPHHDHDHALMPGMLTETEFDDLTAASGTAFDRLFLELMIRHHEGALIMVDDLRNSGGGQEAEIDRLASHIEIEQRIEIDRMRDLLAGL